MTIFLDTNICSFIIRSSSPSLDRKINRFKKGELYISTVVEYELLFGYEKNPSPRLLSLLQSFFSLVKIAPFDSTAAHSSAIVRANLVRVGRLIGAQDMLIAGHALSLDATLITNNTREFSRVTNLKVEDWSEAN